MMEDGVFLWFDVETSGLDPRRDCLLEIGACVTSNGSEMAKVGEPFQATIRRSENDLASMSPFVREMHTKSRLLPRVLDPASQAYEEFHAWWLFQRWAEHTLAGFDHVYLAGRSVHFDRGWLTACYPEKGLAPLPEISHRHFDLTAVKSFAQICGFGIEEAVEDAHRALADVMADIALARALVRRAIR